MQQVRHMFDEIDYVQEGKNADRFASLFCCFASKWIIFVVSYDSHAQFSQMLNPKIEFS